MTTPTELAKMFGIADLDENRRIGVGVAATSTDSRRVGVASVDVASAGTVQWSTANGTRLALGSSRKPSADARAAEHVLTVQRLHRSVEYTPAN